MLAISETSLKENEIITSDGHQQGGLKTLHVVEDMENIHMLLQQRSLRFHYITILTLRLSKHHSIMSSWQLVLHFLLQ